MYGLYYAYNCSGLARQVFQFCQCQFVGCIIGSHTRHILVSQENRIGASDLRCTNKWPWWLHYQSAAWLNIPSCLCDLFTIIVIRASHALFLMDCKMPWCINIEKPFISLNTLHTPLSDVDLILFAIRNFLTLLEEVFAEYFLQADLQIHFFSVSLPGIYRLPYVKAHRGLSIGKFNV